MSSTAVLRPTQQFRELFRRSLLHVDDPRRHRVGGHLADDVQLVKALGRDEVQILMVLDRCTQEFLLQLRRKFLGSPGLFRLQGLDLPALLSGLGG